jgi:hypothetical protein
MIGARHTAGSTISKGGDNSPSNWGIVGRRPCNPLLLDASILRKTEFLDERIVGNHNHSAKRNLQIGLQAKKFRTCWNGSQAAKRPRFIALGRIPVHK